MPPVSDFFRKAAELNRADERREGNVIRLRGVCDVIASGDVHGNRHNLNKIIADAALVAGAQRYLILQELIHAPPDPLSKQDRSIEVLLRAVRLKCEFPQQVLFVMGNHDVAQVTGREVMKNGIGYCKTFIEGIRYAFGDSADEIIPAVDDFLRSMALAVRCDNGVWVSHSAPSTSRMSAAGTAILRRPFTDEDMGRGGAVYEWVWGRGHTPEQLESLAAELGVDFFVFGHQHADAGMEVLSPRAVTITSDHAQGVILRFRTDAPLSAEKAAATVKMVMDL